MLKIKDNIDLKELEKFGFENRSGVCFLKVINIHDGDKELNIELQYYIESKNRLICVTQETFIYGVLDNTIFDLIQAGLVERVGD